MSTLTTLTPAMSAEELLNAMKSVLAEERQAIRTLDAETVLKASSLKEEILQRLQAAPAAERSTLVAGLRDLKGELRRNLVLLAHARAFVRDAIEMCGKPTRGRLQAKL